MSTTAVSQSICGAGTFSATGATVCTTVQAGYYAVDSGNSALSSPYQGAVSEAQATEGYFTISPAGVATASGAVDVQQAQSGYYTVDAAGAATASGAVNEAQAVPGYFTVDSSNAAINSGASDKEPCAAGFYASSAGSTVCTQAIAGTSRAMVREQL